MRMSGTPVLVLFVALALPILPQASAAGMSSGPWPTDPDFGTTRMSENGLYKATFVSRVDPIPLNRIHSWQLHVEDSRGQPLDEAEIAVSGGMPQHGHGLPTQPQVTQNLGNGDFQVEGLRFQMHGWWIVIFEITTPAGKDKVTFNLKL